MNMSHKFERNTIVCINNSLNYFAVIKQFVVAYNSYCYVDIPLVAVMLCFLSVSPSLTLFTILANIIRLFAKFRRFQFL